MSGKLRGSAMWITFRPPEAGEDARPGTVLGFMPCHVCGERCNVALDKGLKVYVYCNGRAADHQCGGSLKYPRKDSQAIIAHWATVKAEPSPAPQPQPKEPDHARVPNPVERAAEAGPAPEPEPAPAPTAGDGGIGRRRFGVGRFRA